MKLVINTKSCQTATERAVGKAVTTVEGLRSGCRRRAHRSSRTSLISSASLVTRRTVMSFTLDPQVTETLHPVPAALAGRTPRPAGDVAAGPPANSRQPSSAFFGGRRFVK
jgi:hypothetical protein